MQCPRCNGLIVHSIYGANDDDPRCASCSRLYPHLKPPTPKPNGSGATKPTRGLCDIIRYTGTVESLKATTCTIRFKPHPSRAVEYPLLEISCPWCGGVAEARDSTTNPAVREYKTGARRHTARKWASREMERDKVVHARTGASYVTCSTGHMFRLKITSDGTYSWE